MNGAETPRSSWYRVLGFVLPLDLALVKEKDDDDTEESPQ